MKYKSLTYAIAMSVGVLTAPLALADLEAGLVAHYPFDGNANDASANGNDGTVHGATLTEDRFGNADSAYSFDGEDDYIKIPYSESFNTQDRVSISLWIKPYDVSNCPKGYGQVIIAHSPEENQYNYWLSLCNMKVKLVAYSDSHSFIEKSDVIPSDNEWYNVAFISERGGDVKVFANGVEIANGTAGPSFWNEGYITIGDLRPDRNLMFNGIIDDIRIYNRALSEDEVKELYEATPNGDCEHATYSPKKRTLTVPFVEMPVVDFLTGQPTGKMELWTGNLRQVSGTTNRFRLLRKTVAQITDGSSSECPATYAVETGTLSIPYIDVPTGVAVGNKEFENGVEVFKGTMTWEPMGRSFVVQEVEMVP